MKKKPELKPASSIWMRLNEDWLSVLIAFLLMLLCAIGLLGPNGIKIVF